MSENNSNGIGDQTMIFEITAINGTHALGDDSTTGSISLSNLQDLGSVSLKDCAELCLAMRRGIHELVDSLMKIISNQIKADRLGIFFRPPELNIKAGHYILLGLIGGLGHYKINEIYQFESVFNQGAPDIIYCPTPGRGWDSILPFRIGKSSIGILTIDDTKSSRTFSDQEKMVLRNIKVFLEIIFKEHKNVEAFGYRDRLTGLYNRWYLDRILPQLNAANKKNQICIAAIDLDNFGKVNKKFGEPFGDVVLYGFAKYLLDSFTGRDIIIRYGGEEIIIIGKFSKEDLLKKLYKLIDLVKKIIFKVGEKELTGLSFSGGIVEFSGDIDIDLKYAFDLKQQAKEITGKGKILS